MPVPLENEARTRLMTQARRVHTLQRETRGALDALRDAQTL